MAKNREMNSTDAHAYTTHTPYRNIATLSTSTKHTTIFWAKTVISHAHTTFPHPALLPHCTLVTFEWRELLDFSLQADVEARGASVLVLLAHVRRRELDTVDHSGIAWNWGNPLCLGGRGSLTTLLYNTWHVCRPHTPRSWHIYTAIVS